MNTSASIKPFELCDAELIVDIMKLRAAIFVVEQQCIYQDPDDLDKLSYHATVFISDELVGYARIIPPQEAEAPYRIGRICLQKAHRGKGYGKKIVENCIKYVQLEALGSPIEISAQTYLMAFYEALGFEAVGEEYLEDGIPHRRMLRKGKSY
jgi:ElaA protein